MPAPESYTVGWISAIETEYVAAQLFLDEKHRDDIAVGPNDNNAYTRGTMGQHNVVIAVLPDGEYGIAAAASVARDMVRTFYNIRIGLMVGIGGGAPTTEHDIRLGDIVVSAPRDGKSGIFQYDFGKTMQDGTFTTTGFMNQPPVALRTAVRQLSAKHKMEGHTFESDIIGILKQRPRLLREYGRPGFCTDRLYRSDCEHPATKTASCEKDCGEDPSKLTAREQRKENEDNPAIHYGLIASANQVMKNAFIRDKLAEEKGVLCFEMEAAGLVNHFPCLVVRGICDYCDSHKNKAWQGYAAMTAAMYAKELLLHVAPTTIEAEKRLSDILQEVAERSLAVLEKQLEVSIEAINISQMRISGRELEENKKCHQVFRLGNGSKAAGYEWYKERVEETVQGTCIWLLEHSKFHNWLHSMSGPLLVTADPGCGKSVLARYLVDHVLPKSSTICYFFFKDQDQNTACQALCAILHQLFTQKPSLIRHALADFRSSGQLLINLKTTLWDILQSAVEDPEAGSVIIVIDALDECLVSEFDFLLRAIMNKLQRKQGENDTLKYIFTSRPYYQIVSSFSYLLEDFPSLHIPGEEESEAISQEINLVITHRVRQLPTRLKGDSSFNFKSHLERRLKATTNRTYLWVYLVFEYLKSNWYKNTMPGLNTALAKLPMSVNEAYEQILSKSEHKAMAWKAMCFILAAARPLALSEMNVAVNTSDEIQSFDQLDLEDEESFKESLRSWCGLFVTVHHGYVYFLHQTAREFLLAGPGASPSANLPGVSWYHSILVQDAHKALAEACVFYLNIFNSDTDTSTQDIDYYMYSTNHLFLRYSAKNWDYHLNEACISEEAGMLYTRAVDICKESSASWKAWRSVYTDFHQWYMPIVKAVEVGNDVLVELLVKTGVDINTPSKSGTPLEAAIRRRRKPAIKMLLDMGARLSPMLAPFRTILCLAVQTEQLDILQLVLDRRTDTALGRPIDDMALGTAIQLEFWDGVQLLLDNCAKDKTPLHIAAERNHGTWVEPLLKRGADIEAVMENGKTALHLAVERGFKRVSELLLDAGANIEANSSNGLAPLHYAVRPLRDLELLRNFGVSGNFEYQLSGKEKQRQLLHFLDRQLETIQLLLKTGANVNARNAEEKTPLHLAAEGNFCDAIELLLKGGAKIEATTAEGETALHIAASKRRDEVYIGVPSCNRANMEARAEDGQMPLKLADGEEWGGSIAFLLEGGVSIATTTKSGKTVLRITAGQRLSQYPAFVLLLSRGANLGAMREDGKTVLQLAAENGIIKEVV